MWSNLALTLKQWLLFQFQRGIFWLRKMKDEIWIVAGFFSILSNAIFNYNILKRLKNVKKSCISNSYWSPIYEQNLEHRKKSRRVIEIFYLTCLEPCRSFCWVGFVGLVKTVKTPELEVSNRMSETFTHCSSNLKCVLFDRSSCFF